MSLPATDNFNRADTSGLGPNWHGGCQIVSNQAAGLTGGAFNVDWWTADTPGADHYSQVKVNAANADHAADFRLTDASNFYMIYNAGSGGVHLFKRVAGSFTSLNNFGGTVASGDILKGSAVGTALHAYQNGGELSGSPITDTAFATGTFGIVCFGNVAALDDWEGGNVGGAAAQVPYQPQYQWAPVMAQ